MMERLLRYKGKNKNVEKLGKEIVQELIEQDYKVESNATPNRVVIQARKDGVLRDIITANRAFTILLQGSPEDFTVRIGIGKLVQNLSVAAAEALVLSNLFLVIDIPEMLWTTQVEKGIIKDIKEIVGGEPTEEKSGIEASQEKKKGR
jgi:hypothetical protein